MFVALFAFIASYNVMACDQEGEFPDTDPSGNTVGVPLDGGLLTILAAAGATYFAARKKKKNQV